MFVIISHLQFSSTHQILVNHRKLKMVLNFHSFLLIFTVFVYRVSTSAESETAVSDQVKLRALNSCLVNGGISNSDLVERDNPSQRHEYNSLNYQWSKLNGIIMPLAYLVVSRTSQISTAVRCCQKAGIQIVPRSGGHSYMKLGHGNEHSLVVDLQRMNDVQLLSDPTSGETTVRIGAGARSGKVQYKIWAQSNGTLMMPAPYCTSVGVAGFTLGGGFDEIHSREMGLGSDNVLQMYMVDWTGAVRTVNNHSNQDLFWALRGGGGGNFGIVTSFEFKTYPAPEKIGYAVVNYDMKDFVPFFKAWQQFIVPDPDREVGTLVVFAGNMINMTLYSKRQGAAGGSVDVERILTNFPTPSDLSINEFTIGELMVHIAQSYSEAKLTSPADMENITDKSLPAGSRWKKVKSFYVDRLLTQEEDFVRLQDVLTEFLSYSSTEFAIEHYGGAVKTIGPSDTAFIHRHVLYDVQLAVFSKCEEDEVGVQAMNHIFDETKPLFRHTESYQNYMDEDMPDWLQRYYGANLERLVGVKRKVDPHNVFYGPKSIPLHI